VATTTAFYIFVGVLLLQRTKSIQVHKGGRTTTKQKIDKRKGRWLLPFLDRIGSNTHAMLCYTYLDYGIG
jgi:hypothetical protein